MPEQIKVRNACLNDIEKIVDIHIDAFQGFFLTSLGKNFLRFYYSCFLKSKETVTMVAVKDEVLLGFSASTMVCKGFNNRLIKSNLLSFGFLAIKMLFTEPKSLLRLARNLTKKSESVEDNEDYAELYSIGVSKEAQGMGVGKKLLFATEEELKKNSVQQVSLTTDFYDNDSVIGFYKSMGYNTLYEFVTFPNRKMFRLIKKL